jgi:uncharacterized membrane protein YqaE (UPF0057 family)
MATMATKSAVALPKNSPAKTTGLILLSLIFSPLVVYLDGGSSMNVFINFIFWVNLVWLISIPWAIAYVLRSDERRKMSRPWRYRLWVRNGEGYPPHSKATTNKTASPGQGRPTAVTTFNHIDQAKETPFGDSKAALQLSTRSSLAWWECLSPLFRV